MNYLKKAYSEIPEEDKVYVKLSMDLATQIDEYRKKENLSKREFANEIGKEESEISKWLSGTHNFTIRTLAKIQTYFQKRLFTIEKDIQREITVYKVFELNSQNVELTNKPPIDWNYGGFIIGEPQRITVYR